MPFAEDSGEEGIGAMLVDSHTHLLRLEVSPEDAVRSAAEVGVVAVVMPVVVLMVVLMVVLAVVVVRRAHARMICAHVRTRQCCNNHRLATATCRRAR